MDGIVERWAGKLLLREGSALRRRVGIVRGGLVVEHDVHDFARALSTDALFQIAAVLARGAADDEAVALVASVATPKGAGARSAGAGPIGPAALVVARSRDGFVVSKVLRSGAWSGGSRTITTIDAPAELMAAMDDFTDPSALVDPALDDRLAEARFPGAVRRASNMLAAVLRPPAVAAVEPEPDVAFELPAETPATAGEAPKDYPFPRPWQAMREGALDLFDLRPMDLGAEPLCTMAAPPVGLQTRSIADLIARGWQDEAQALAITMRIRSPNDFAATTRAFLETPGLPPIARLLACARGAAVARRCDAREHAVRFGSELVARFDAMVESEGGLGAWISTAWPDPLPVVPSAGSAMIACAAVAAFWRVALAQPRISGDAASRLDLSERLGAIAAARRVRDAILDRAGIAQGEAGARLVAFSSELLTHVPSDGESRVARWHDALRGAGRSAAYGKALRHGAVWHAAVLHSIAAMAELAAQWRAALAFDDVSQWRPEDIATTGLFDRARTVLARHMTLRAGAETDRAIAVAKLERAVRTAPREASVASCYAEARFRAGKLDAALLADLIKEAGVSLGAAAEALATAELLGDRPAAGALRKRLLERAGTGPHAWAARVRVAFSRAP